MLIHIIVGGFCGFLKKCWVWDISLRIFFFSNSSRLPASFVMPFLMSESYSIVQIYYIFFILSSVMGHLACFQSLAIMNRAAMKMVEQESLRQDKVSFGYMPKNSIAGSGGILIPIFLRNKLNSTFGGFLSHNVVSELFFLTFILLLCFPVFKILSYFHFLF